MFYNLAESKLCFSSVVRDCESVIILDESDFHVFQLYAICSDREPIYIVTELMSGGSLLNYLLEGEGKNFDLKTLVYIGAQVAEGMAYLEEKQYIHCDLAARNILVGEYCRCKIKNFGLLRLIDDKVYTPHEGVIFPIKWTAPEAALFNKYSVKSDVWSFGILMTEIVTKGSKPYSGMGMCGFDFDRIEKGYRMPQPRGCPDSLYKLMLQCWSKEPEERPRFSALELTLYDWCAEPITFSEPSR